MSKFPSCEPLRLASEMRGDLPEAAWHVSGCLWELEDRAELVVQDRLWAKVKILDVSGETTLHAAQPALLEMAQCTSKEDFLKRVSEDTLVCHRCDLRVTRKVKTLFPGTPNERDVANMVVQRATAVFVVKQHVQDQRAAFADTRGVLPCPLSKVSSSDSGSFMVDTVAGDGNKQLED